LLNVIGRTAVPALGVVLAAAACGTPSAANGSAPGATRAPGGTRLATRPGAAGELVQINGTTLILSGNSGDVTVVYSTSTVITRQSTGTYADIAAGRCALLTGQKDSTGTLTANAVTLVNASGGTCDFQTGGAFTFVQRSPRPGFTPPPGAAQLSLIRGLVTGVSGTQVTVQDSSGASQEASVPTTVRVNLISSATPSDLALHECIRAAGSNAAGAVTATSLTIVPAGPSGCFSGGRGFFGGGGGGGGGGFGGPPGG
jgi:hypothetical protein